jgi:D-glycero-D-manno-heptose 1,7-bisphosphate phosphatase
MLDVAGRLTIIATPMFKRPAVFFDRDNTLIACDGYLGDPNQVALATGAADTIARLRALGFRIVVVSNQSGVARGMFSEDDVRAVNQRMNQMLLEINPRAVIDRHEFCPHHPEATVEQYRQDCDCRKPKSAMLLHAAQTMQLDLNRSWMVGDAPRDIEAGKSAGCRAILLRQAGLTPPPTAQESASIEPDATVETLKEAADYIERNLARRSPQQTSVTEHPPISKVSLRPPSDADFVEEPSAEAAHSASGPSRLEAICEQILSELRRSHQHDGDFSVIKLLAGIVQILSLAALLMAYIQTHSGTQTQTYILVALTLQTLTISLLIMGKQK